VAHSFGPLVEETLELADGMTVVVGDNESAKSSWHAAIYSALCGRRRGKGRPSVDDQRFAELHKPWDRDDWSVTAEVVLDDGRRIELHQDLEGKVDCYARDLDLGRDYSAEIMNDGTPDASRWFGLDRRSFVTTASIAQTNMLELLERPDALQEALQRAAATAGTDETASAALDRISEFQRERVGTDRSNSTKPMRRALDRVRSAEDALGRARAAHRDYEQRLATVEALRESAGSADGELNRHEAAASVARAEDLQRRAGRAATLDARFGGVPPPTAVTDEDTARQVAEALSAWRSRPELPVLDGWSSVELTEQISALPAMPVGDIRPDETVQRAAETLREAERALAQHDSERPALLTAPQEMPDASGAELLDLARTLEGSPPVADSTLDEEIAAAAAALAAAEHSARWNVTLLVTGAVVALLGVVALVAGLRPTGAAALFGGTVALVIGLVLRLRHRGVAGLRRSLATLQVRESAREQVTAESYAARERAVARCAQLGIDPNVEHLRALAVRSAQWALNVEQEKQWIKRHEQFEEAVEKARSYLADALSRRGHSAANTDLWSALNAYVDACTVRADQASRARERRALEERRAERLAAEGLADQAEQAREAADKLVVTAAASCGATISSAEEAVAALESWQGHRDEAVRRLDEALQSWTELQHLLGGGTLADLKARAEAAMSGVEQDRNVLDGRPVTDISEQQLSALRDQARVAAERARDAEGALREFAESLPSVTEAEEEVAYAHKELARVKDLDETLTLTRRFLAEAQDEAHRTIAPILAGRLRHWLPDVTAGRYTDAAVDPETLRVEVRGAGHRWRAADRLSCGTAEQVYLLLRVALVSHLTEGNETCPLLLDDITVHADSVRTPEILDLLLRVSDERQVVMFTQEEAVEAWAAAHLDAPRHAIWRLPIVTMV
jgi:hypothetical protein